MSTSSPDTPHCWEQILSRLEIDVEAAERLLASPDHATGPEHQPASTVWTAPTDAGPVPDRLRPRAEDLLARQQRTAEALALSLAANNRQRDFAARVTGATAARAVPTYLDVQA